MSIRVFPGTTHTFSVRRDIGLVPDPFHHQNQIDGGKQIIATGVSIQLKPMVSMQIVEQGGSETQGRFIGHAYTGTDIRPNDDLLDETANGTDGSPVSYTVTDTYDNGYYCQVFLRLKGIG